jgi:hypothetical protein
MIPRIANRRQIAFEPLVLPTTLSFFRTRKSFVCLLTICVHKKAPSPALHPRGGFHNPTIWGKNKGLFHSNLGYSVLEDFLAETLI